MLSLHLPLLVRCTMYSSTGTAVPGLSIVYPGIHSTRGGSVAQVNEADPRRTKTIGPSARRTQSTHHAAGAPMSRGPAPPATPCAARGGTGEPRREACLLRSNPETRSATVDITATLGRARIVSPDRAGLAAVEGARRLRVRRPSCRGRQPSRAPRARRARVCGGGAAPREHRTCAAGTRSSWTPEAAARACTYTTGAPALPTARHNPQGCGRD